MTHYRRIAQLKTAADFREYLAQIGADLPFDETLQSGADMALAQPLPYGGKILGNRFAVLPMEGWDASADGHPTDNVRRRWRRFGISGANLIWGGEAVAVRHDGRANPRQLVMNEHTVAEIADLREGLIASHRERYGNDSADNLLIGLQLTHSGRFCRPNDNRRLEPQILYRHPLLDEKYQLSPDQPLLGDDDISRLIDDFVRAAKRVQQAGFDFVDVKHCHGYLGHEFLSAVDRGGRYGGSFENRTRFLREIVAGIRAEAPGLHIGVRFSAVDSLPFTQGADGHGVPQDYSGPYRYAFGGDASGVGFDLSEPFAFLDLLAALDIRLVCVTVGSPYYNPHMQRPALFPPSDGYPPPEDPLLGVARHISVTRQLKGHRPDLIFVGTGYSYLQEWLPHVSQHVVRTGQIDLVGLGRMALAYPELMADVLAGRPVQRRRLCRTFSDCTTAPRNGLVSGCYPLDEFYAESVDAKVLLDLKKLQKARG